MTYFSPKEVASFDVDAQKTFTPLCPDELPVPQGGEIVDQLNEQAQWAQWRIGSKDAHSPHAIWISDPEHPPLSSLQAEQADRYWPAHATVGTTGFELIEGLPKPEDYDFFVWKGVEPYMHPYGACYHDLHNKLSTGVIEFLHGHAIKAVIVGGLATDYCVKTTVLQLCQGGFTVFLNLAACRGIAQESTEAAIACMQSAGTILLPASQALSAHITKR